MRNLLALLAAAAIAFVGAGWYLGWFHIEDLPSRPGQRSVKIDIDSAKIGEDLHKGGERLQEAIEKSRKDNSSSSNEKNKIDSIPTGSDF